MMADVGAGTTAECRRPSSSARRSEGDLEGGEALTERLIELLAAIARPAGAATIESRSSTDG